MLLGRKTADCFRLVLAMALIAGVASAGILMLAPDALAGSGWSLPRNLSGSGNNDVYGTRIAMGPDGFPHVVWRQWDGADNLVYYSRETGNGWTAPVNLSSGFNDNMQQQVAVDAAGNPHVVWQADDSGVSVILYVTSIDGGFTWVPTRALNNAATLLDGNPCMVLDSNGYPHVAWEAYDGISTDRVFYSRFDGSDWTAPVSISPGVNEAYAPVLAVAGDGSPHAAWRGHDGVTLRIYYAADTGGGWSLPENISPGANLTINRFPELAIDAAGNPHVAWQTIENGNGNHICYATSTGGGWTAPLILSTTSTDNWFPSLAIAGDGTKHLAWQGDDGSDNRIYYSTGTGSGWTAPAILSTSSAVNRDARLAVDGRGFPHVVWQGSDTSTARIFFSKNTGSGWTDPLSISSGVTDSAQPRIALDQDNFPHVAWHGSDGTNNRAWYASDISEQFKAYFAEGYTGEGFQEYLCLGNPGGSDQSVKVTYLFTDGTSLERTYGVPALSRFTVNVNAEVGESRDVSIKCASSAVFVAERPMYFDYAGGGGSWSGGSDVIGAPAPATGWYFAEGYTGPGFDEYVCVLNPGAVDANLTFNFQTEEEGEIAKAGFSVPAHSRATFKANDLLDGKSYQTSLSLQSDQPVVAERPMYFDYQGTAYWGWTGGHCVMGRTSFSDEYFFAEGTTRTGFEEWLTLQNPENSAITVNAVYQLGTGETVEDYYNIEPLRRMTVYVPNVVGEDQDVSIHLSSTDPFLAERPMYFYYTGTAGHDWTGGHCVIGAATQSRDWFFAEGYTGDGFDEWLCIQNPGTVNAEVEVYFYPEGGAEPIFREYLVPANTRFTVNVNADAGPGLAISAGVVSDQPVIVERPMYFNYGGSWTGGHDVLGLVP